MKAPKGIVSTENSTSHPNESKGMKLARMRFSFVFFSRKGEEMFGKFHCAKEGILQEGR